MKFDEVKDSGERQDFGTGSVRDTQTGKGRYDLLPPRAVRRLAQHFENGAVKYGDRNWEKGQPLGRYLDSALRHTFAILQGKRDEDHAAAAAWNLLAFIETAERIEAGEMQLDRDVANALDDIGYVQDGSEGPALPTWEGAIGGHGTEGAPFILPEGTACTVVDFTATQLSSLPVGAYVRSGWSPWNTVHRWTGSAFTTPERYPGAADA